MKITKTYLKLILNYLHCFFSEMLETECLDIDQEFIVDIATNFENFFVNALPYFIKTMMLSENERIRTFSIDWPHSSDYISIKNMALSGLYFTGIDDSVKCVFCSANIHQWMTNDDPVADHYRCNINCQFLWNPKLSSNISGKSSEKELRKLLDRLPRNGYDEVD